VNTNSDSTNCGHCDNPCDFMESCSGGGCYGI
jgi:hypothetical protein